jgi:CheY-like chemotaxis protein
MKGQTDKNSGAIRKTILVVDDLESILEYVKSLLEKDYDIVTKSDGQEALVYLSDGHIPDLILLDMEMPNMNGRVFLRRLRYGSSKHNKVPIIFITSVSSKIMIKSMMKFSIMGYIIKPFKPEELIEKVRNVLQP